jgi:hypothetical protein
MGVPFGVSAALGCGAAVDEFGVEELGVGVSSGVGPQARQLKSTTASIASARKTVFAEIGIVVLLVRGIRAMASA